MVLSALIGRLDPLAVHGSPELQVDRVTRDSRQAGAGAVFVAIRGERVDGHDFVAGLSGGAAVVERRVPQADHVVQVVVQDTGRALAQIAAAFAGDPAERLPVVGITGTNGKTTISALCASAFTALGRSAGRIGTLGAAWPGVERASELTTPESTELQTWLRQMLDAGVHAAFTEVSSIALPRGRADALPFHTVVFTNLGRDHLDLHGDMDAYARAKAMLFRPERLRPAGGAPRAVLCGDDPAWQRMGPPVDRWLYGFDPQSDVQILAAELETGGQSLRLRTPDGIVQLHSPLIGRHNALNLAGALAILATLGVSWADAARGLGAVPPVRGRLEPVPDPGGRIVLVDYAHTPDALQAVLATLRTLTTGEVWVVFGCGGGRDAGKRPLMGEVASRLADRVVVTSDNPRHESPQQIVDQILTGVVCPVEVELDRAAAIRRAVVAARPGDVVLIAGKGHERTQEIAGERLPFDDRAVAAALLEAP